MTKYESVYILEPSYDEVKAQEVAALEAKTAAAYDPAKYELYKSSSHFDSTARNPEWLG